MKLPFEEGFRKGRFKPKGSSLRLFREARHMQDLFADYKKERRCLWFTFKGSDQLPQWACCYAVYIDDELVYIGQTENLMCRFQQHRAKGIVKGVPWGSFYIKAKLPRRYGEWAMTELRLIKRLRPRLNRARVYSLGE